MKNKQHKSKPKKFRMQKYLKVTFIYFMLYICIFGLIDYYALLAFNFLWFLVLSIIVAIPTGYYHMKYAKHDHIDDIANELL